MGAHRPAGETLAQLLDRRSESVPMTGCRIWLGAVNSKGYGQFNEWKAGKTISHKTHRLAWQLVNGPIPDGMLVCHKCDVTSCINPAHLFLGTNLDNARDRDAKQRNRQPRGSQQPQAKLNESMIPAIRADARPTLKIAKDYGVSWTLIKYIKQGKNWKHV